MGLKSNSQILLVDDDDFSLRTMREMLGRMGLRNVSMAKNATEAIDFFNNNENDNV